jgi:hypothetical protein
MNRDYTKLWAEDVVRATDVLSKGKMGWHLARPLPYYGWKYRLRDAWNVLTFKADALYWECDHDR